MSYKENKFVQSIQTIFRAISLSYIIRNYIWALFFMFVFSHIAPEPVITGYHWICLLCYPFARFAFDEAVNFMGGGGSWILSFKNFVLVKFAVVSFLFVLAPFVAPLCFLYLYIRINVLKK